MIQKIVHLLSLFLLCSRKGGGASRMGERGDEIVLNLIDIWEKVRTAISMISIFSGNAHFEYTMVYFFG